MNKTKQSVLLFIMLIVAGYLSGAFISLEINPIMWEITGRAIYATVWVAVSAIFSRLYYES